MANYTASAGIIGQVQSTATAGNVNGGFFNTLNANFLTDGAATSATGNSPVFTSASYNFVAGDVGHWIYIKSGTNWTPGWYQIASVASNAATLSAAIGQGIQVANNIFGTNTVAGCATTDSPTGATWGIDYSQSDTARYSNSVLTGATTTCTDATNPFTTQMVGNFINMNSGTGVTAGWYEIVSVSAGTATLDRSAGTTYSAVVCKIGGAISLGGSTTGITDVLFFAQGTSSATNTPIFFIAGSATYTLNSAVTVVNGNASWKTRLIGYTSLRSNIPSASARPIINTGSNIFTSGSNNVFYNLIIKGTASSICFLDVGSSAVNCKALNTSSSAAQNAFNLSGNGPANQMIKCEAICYRGKGIFVNSSNGLTSIIGCYIHDCDIGISLTTNSVIESCNILNNIIEGCVTYAIRDPSGSTSAGVNISGNTLYGAENKLGTGISTTSTENNYSVLNNIIYGFSAGVTWSNVNQGNYHDYNDYYNNTNDISDTTKWQKGANDIAVDPLFTSVTQRTGATATTTAGNHLVQSGATFVTWGITAGVDCVYIKSGTGITPGIYGILSVDSETQITVDITLTANATADKVWQITQGHNFAVGTNLKAKGYPGLFPGGLTTGYLDIGGVQRQEVGSSTPILESAIIQGLGAV